MREMGRARIDTELRMETAEGVSLSLSPAGLLPRLYAYLIDLTLRGVIFFVLAIPLLLLAEIAIGPLLLIAFALEWLYPVVFEATRGRTPGKALLGLRVVSVDGSPITFGASLLRNLLRVTDLFPVGYALGGLVMLASSRSQRLGDIAADALVVHEDRQFHQSARLPAGATAPLGVPLGVEEQRAVIEFAHRRGSLGEARAEELAAMTGAAAEGAPRARVEALMAAARWYEGGHR